MNQLPIYNLNLACFPDLKARAIIEEGGSNVDVTCLHSDTGSMEFCRMVDGIHRDVPVRPKSVARPVLSSKLAEQPFNVLPAFS